MRPVWMSLAAGVTLGIPATWLSRGSTVAPPANMGRAAQPVHVPSAPRFTDVSPLSREAPAPAIGARDPFVFAARPKTAGAARSGRAPIVASSTRIPTPNRAPDSLHTLVGIAEEVTDAGLVRTAVLIRPDASVLFVHDGDLVGERFRVVAIEASAMTLTNPESGASTRLLLLQ